VANLSKTIDRAADISRDVGTRLERRVRKAFATYTQRAGQLRAEHAEQFSHVRTPWDLWREGAEYAVDFAQRSALFWDTLRQRGNDYIEHERAGKPPLLAYEYDMLSDGRKFERPVNYALVRIVTPAGIKTDESLRPFIIVDPRAGHGPGIGGFKADSEVGVALLAGHAVYFVIFFPEPEEGQTLADVVDAEAEFVRIVGERHPKSAKPVLVGNCQAGWAVMLLAASRPELVGAIVLNGAPMSYWSGNDGENPMRYAGGLMGGAWSSLLASDLGAGKFDGAHLVQNFENLNPSNAFWGKYYHLWENIDTEPERFLDFERWWGGYYLLNDEEIRWIVNNLFVGNKLAAGEAKLGPGRFFDLKSITSPIIIFASMGDNITPPQQAFNWIADVYRNSDEIKANGQTIVGLVHEDIGHLGIFVSGAVAKKEHAQIIEVLKYIQQLPPGLYGMDIHEAVGLDGSTAYEVSLAERKVEEVRQLQKRDRLDEKPFEAVAAVSELTERAYELLVRPMVREAVPEWAAKAAREFHPLRAQRWMFSDKNPMLAGLPYLAFTARSGRKAAGESNAMRQREKLASELITATLDLYRDLRDAGREAAFYQIYGSLVSLQVADQRAETRRDSKFDPRQVPAVRQVLETLEDGDLQEGLTRMALLLAKEGGGTRELSQMARAREILAPARGIKPMSEDEVRRLLHEETIVTEFEPERARRSLPRLIRTRAERKIARAYLDRVESGMPLNDRQRALLNDFRERLPSPAGARTAVRKPRQAARRRLRR